jgi:hypothetical protein
LRVLLWCENSKTQDLLPGDNTYILVVFLGLIPGLSRCLPELWWKLLLEFIKSLKDASLKNGDLTAAALHQIHNPPEHVLDIDNDDELYSLKQFLATQNASQRTYADFAKAHNEQFPAYPMLLYAQMKYKSAEWRQLCTCA